MTPRTFKLFLSLNHQEDDNLVSGFSDIFPGFQVSGNLETGNLVTDLVILKMYIKVLFRRFPGKLT